MNNWTRNGILLTDQASIGIDSELNSGRASSTSKKSIDLRMDTNANIRSTVLSRNVPKVFNTVNKE